MATENSRNLPNILVIMSDEHDPAVTGCYSDPIIRTPNLDRLAAQGVTFDAAYTTSPLCVPARLSFTAGKYISRCGAWSNQCWLPGDEYPSLPRMLNRSGYESFLGGKMHFDISRRYGFIEIYPASSNRSHKTGQELRRDPADKNPNFLSWQERSSKFHVGDDSRIMSHDRLVTQHCSEFLRKRERSDRPFFMVAGYLAPHFPLIVPENYWQRYRDKIPMPHLPSGFEESLPTNYHQLKLGFGLTDTEPDTVKLGRELYWGLTDWLDNEIGKLLDALANSAVADNTLVIYTSDHGENKGDHGLWWKNNMYEHSCRIPLIMSLPSRWKGNQRRESVCSLVDVVQTIADIAEVRCPEDWNGDSLLPLLDKPSVPWKNFAVSEYYAHNIASGYAMLREDAWKYVYHTRINENFAPERELYHLQADPGEFNNLATLPEHAHRIEQMHRKLINEIGRDPEEAELECRADYARGYQRD
ncbi:sulfatase-like hydrolase/transferase [candidate division KSB1 bacterium]|nr:sulfatase-like hydrolase/transferase [candidate division KSB1 bacterium]